MKIYYSLLLLSVIIILIITRIYSINTVPANEHPDGLDALNHYLIWKQSSEESGTLSPILNSNWNGSHALNNYLLTLPWEIAGRPFWGLRIAPIIFSITTVLVVFIILVKLVKKWETAFLGALLLTVNPWFLNFSRSSWENIANALAVSILILAYVLDRKREWISIGLVVLVTIISPYLYHPGKVIFIVGLCLLFYLIFFRLNVRSRSKTIVFLLALALIVIGTIPYFSKISTDQLQRLNAVYIGKEANTRKILIQNLHRSSMGVAFFYSSYWHGGMNGRYLPLDGWLIPQLLICLYWIGIVYSIKKAPLLILIYVLLYFPINLLSLQTPDAARSVHIVPLIFVFIGLGMWIVYLGLKRICNNHHNFQIVIFLLLTLIILITAVGEWQRYWRWINSSEALKAREPAIFYQEYQFWLQENLLNIQRHGNTNNIGEWRSKYPSDDYYTNPTSYE